MGVLNVTPDSFSDGGRHQDLDAAVARARVMIAEGAAIIDVGGESTRPGAAPVDLAEERRRVIPVIARLASETSIPISVDTIKPQVMVDAVAAGACLINDVNALRADGALAAAAATGAAVCLMHMQGDPRTMQVEPHYQDVVREVAGFLNERVAACVAAGISRDRLLIDPGIGFGKRLEHNLALLAHLDVLTGGNLPVLVGVSRKSVIGTLLNRPVEARLAGGVALAALAVESGAAVIRTHDVAPTVDAITVAAAVRRARGERKGERTE